MSHQYSDAELFRSYFVDTIMQGFDLDRVDWGSLDDEGDLNDSPSNASNSDDEITL